MCISHIKITTDQIVYIIKKYNTNKAHGYDKVSVPMLQLCAVEVAIPLGIIFRKCVITGIFPDSWKYMQMCSLFIRKTPSIDIQLHTDLAPTYLWENIGKNCFWSGLLVLRLQ